LKTGRNTVGVLRLSALGDAVLTVPLIHSLISSELFDEVIWVTTNEVSELIGPIKGCRYVILEKISNFRTVFRNWQKLKAESFNQLILAQASFSAHAISVMIRAKSKIGFDKKRGKDLHHFFIDKSISYVDQHFVDAYIELGILAGAPPFRASWDLAFTHLDEGWARSFRQSGRKLVALHPHPSKIERRWTNLGYAELLRLLVNSGCDVLILGGANDLEKKLNNEISNRSSINVKNLTGVLNLTQWASLLQEVDLLVAPDTGAIHLACALSTKVVGLYAVANPQLAGPYNQLNHCVNRYPDALRKFSNCERTDYHNRVHDLRAMELIELDDVWEKVSSALTLG
jgi:heptosyltransferase I